MEFMTRQYGYFEFFLSCLFRLHVCFILSYAALHIQQKQVDVLTLLVVLQPKICFDTIARHSVRSTECY